MHRTGEMTAFRLTLQPIYDKRTAAMSAYKTLKKTASQERILFGQRLIKAKAKAQNTTVEAQEIRLKDAFGQRKIAQQVKQLTGKQRTAPLHSVYAPDMADPTSRTEFQDK